MKGEGKGAERGREGEERRKGVGKGRREGKRKKGERKWEEMGGKGIKVCIKIKRT